MVVEFNEQLFSLVHIINPTIVGCQQKNNTIVVLHHKKTHKYGVVYMTNHFGERLKLALKNAGYTQKKATEELQLSKNAITNYVAGRIPDAQILHKLAKLCSVSMEWLLTGHDHTEIQAADSQELTSDEKELLQLFRQLSFRDQMKALGYMELATEQCGKKATSSNLVPGEEAATDETA